MRSTNVTPRQEMRVGAGDAPDRLRQVLQMADVSKISVKDTHGHTIVDVPVERDGIGSVLEPVVAATKAIADTVGDVTLTIEKRPELPSQAGSSAEGSSAGVAQERRAAAQRMATGREMPDDVTAEEVARSKGSTPVTQADVERIREANAVPTGDAARVKRMAPEQKGEPDLKDTGEWPDFRQGGA